MVLGLSLTADDFVWVLVDEADGTVVDHDSVEFRAGAEIAGAARGAHAIATAGGIDVDRIRLTWNDDVARDGMRLRNRLNGLDIGDVEAVPLTCAIAVLVDPDMEPSLALAYGAARARVGLPATTGRPRRRRSRMAMAALGAAAAAAFGGLLLTSGSLPHAEQTAAASEPPAVTEPGWVSVPAPSNNAATVVRKVVEAPRAVPARPAPQPAAVAAAPAAEPLVAAVPAPVGVPHLQVEEPHLVGPEAAQPALETGTAAAEVSAAPFSGAPAAEFPAPAPVVADPMAAGLIPADQSHLPVEHPVAAPDMTDPVNVSSGTP